MIKLPGTYVTPRGGLYENTMVYVGMDHVLIVFSREPLEYTVMRLSSTGAFIDPQGYVNGYSAHAEIVGSMLRSARIWSDAEYYAFKEQQDNSYTAISKNAEIEAAIRVLERQGYNVEKKN